MRTYILSFLLIMMSLCCFGQGSQLTVNVEHEHQAIFGVNVYIPKLEIGGITDEKGNVILTDIPNGTFELIISYVGFQSVHQMVEIPSMKSIKIDLEEAEQELEVIEIKSTRSSRSFKTIPTRVEFIAGEELGEKAIMNSANISVVLRESTGIQMQQTSLSSGNSNIRIQGLDGRYTQLLKDGFPLYGGFSSGLSIMQIPPLDLAQFEIIKGSSSTLYGGGAIAGLVNMVSKTPKKESNFEIMLTQTQAKGSTGNIFYSKRNKKIGLTLYGSAHYQKEFDPEEDHFSNLPRTKTITFNPKLFYYPSKKTTISLGFNGTIDDRTGGDMARIDGQKGVHQFYEKNESKRWSGQFFVKSKLSENSSLNFKSSYGLFKRKLELPSSYFGGNQINTFAELTFATNMDVFDFVIGANHYGIKFNEESSSALKHNQYDITHGVFVNSIYDITRDFILESGIRLDYDSDYGLFPLPRLSLLYKKEDFSTRLGGGFGYKLPNIFISEAEHVNYKNIDSIDKTKVKAETSQGVNLDFNYKLNLSEGFNLSINQLFYLTSIDEALILKSNVGGGHAFKNATSNILTKGMETNIKFSFKDFKWFLNYALIDTKLNYLQGCPQKPLTSKHNAGSVLVYETEKWLVGYETYYTGSQFLANGYKTRDYYTMGFLLMRTFDKFKVFANFENFTDVRQSNFTPLVLPPHSKPNFPEIYAPTDGFIFSIGIVIKPFTKDKHGH